MGKHTGYDIYHNQTNEGGGLSPSDWASTKAAARRRVDHTFEVLTRNHDPYSRWGVVVIAVDPDTGEVIGGKTEAER